ncbi:MAG: nucleotidyltransferase family protein [Desulfobacteraceae bacterium]
MAHIPFDLPQDRIADFCQRWQITELALFGSALRDDFSPESDIDVLVTFAANARWSLFDLVTMEDELRAIVGRDVDLVERRAVEKSENYIRRRHILESAEPLYVAG